MKNLKQQIKEILEDNEFYQPEMIIEEKEPFFWRLNSDWVNDKVEQILKIIKEEK